MLVSTLLAFSFALAPPLSAKSRERALDESYLSAVSAADRLVQAWQNADFENGIILLSSRAKQMAGPEAIHTFFSNAAPSGYEIGKGKVLKSGVYEFPVVLVSRGEGHRAKRRFSSVVVINTGHNDWAVDKLP